jgi:hypothetical protein
MMAEIGYAGFALFLIWIVSVYRRAVAFGISNPYNAGYAAIIIALMTAILVSSGAEDYMVSVGCLPTAALWLLCGIVASLPIKQSKHKYIAVLPYKNDVVIGGQ